MDIRQSIILALLFYSISVKASRYKVCARKNRTEEHCNSLQSDGNVNCSYVDNEASCFTKMQAGEIDFGSVDAETVFLASKFSSNVMVFAYLVTEIDGKQFNDETVVLSTKPISTFKELKGMTYSHPGLDVNEIPPLLLKELEAKILNLTTPTCDLDTTVEVQLKALNEFFGPSCRPGKWVIDKELDKRLKEKYPKLTELCPKFESLGGPPLERALLGMINTAENALCVTTLNTVENLKNNLKNVATYYLCKDGNTRNDVCVWSRQRHRILVMQDINGSNRNLPKEMQEWFSASRAPVNRDAADGSRVVLTDQDVTHLKDILGMNETSEMKLAFLDQNSPVDDFVKEFRHIPNPEDNEKICKSIKWCTVSVAEHEKCKWLAQASLNYGIQPVIECVQKVNKLDCIRAVSREEADVVAISADLGYAAKRFDLSPIAFPETTSDDEIRTLLLVKDEADITSLESLRGKKGCFPLYGGIAWLSFINITRGILLSKDSCNYEMLLRDTLGDSCMPGATVYSKAIQSDVDVTKMCQSCTEPEKTCNANEATNWYFDNADAVKCLEGKGDFAVIVKNKTTILPNGVRIMCRNGTKVMDVDENCYLSVPTTSMVVTHRTNSRSKDIQLALIEYGHWFAAKEHTPFRLFDSFNKTTDLLFKDSTPGLDLPSSNKQSIRNYMDLFRHVGDCPRGITTIQEGGKASKTRTTVSLFAICLIVNLFT